MVIPLVANQDLTSVLSATSSCCAMSIAVGDHASESLSVLSQIEEIPFP